MYIKKVLLSNFRNYSHLSAEFFDGINIIEGKNAQGKTNLLEAIFFCCIGKSMRASREKEVIKFGEDTARVKIEVQKSYKTTEVYLLFSKLAKKTIKIDGIPIRRIGELLGELNAVYFSPDELRLIKDAPEDRRRFMDIHISQTSKQYFYYLGRYEKILANRNRLLKDVKDISVLKETLPIWDTQLVDIGAKIVYMRVRFIENLSPYAQKAHTYLTTNAESLELEYSGLSSDAKKKFTSLENALSAIRDELSKKLQKSIDKDIKLGYTTVGPHRDDIKISVNGIDIRAFGSQGQQRTVALSLKLAELEIMKEETGEMPILLLDDVLSELDASRRDRLLKFCAKTQTFITGTDFPKDLPNAKYFQVKNATIN